MQEPIKFACMMAAAMSMMAGAQDVPPADVTIEKPAMRWLWGGFGFHNSEATMTPMMSKEFRDQRVLKTFREISPIFRS